MSENRSIDTGSLPIVTDKDLLSINQLMAEKQYRIKIPGGFLHTEKADKVNPDFILYTLNDYLGHLQKCAASTKKMLPVEKNSAFYEKLAHRDPVAFRFVSIVSSLDIRKLTTMLMQYQSDSKNVSVTQLIPFIRLLYKTLIQVYYLGPSGVAREYRQVYGLILSELVPADPAAIKEYLGSAIEEWYYIFEQIIPGLYPLVLRMCSSSMQTMHQLFYANGSKVLLWLQVSPSDVLILNDLKVDVPVAQEKVELPEIPVTEEPISTVVPEEVKEGISVLEQLFPEAGWGSLETLPDMCSYFQPILLFQDAFTQLSPKNPLHQTLILFWVLEELFQGLRLIKFEPLLPLSNQDDIEDINRILEDWILYQESVFDKSFSADLKAFTHQIYTQPDYYKTPYGRKLLSNMYTVIRTMFLPHFDIKMYGSAKLQKDERLPPFYIRVARLKRVLCRYNESIKSASADKKETESSVPGVLNPWEPYKFDIANPVSRRLDAICGGKHSKIRVNALLIQYTLSILNVLDWWINNKNSYAYREAPDYLYRVIEPGSSIPAFGVRSRTDVDTIFVNHLKERLSASEFSDVVSPLLF